MFGKGNFVPARDVHFCDKVSVFEHLPALLYQQPRYGIRGG